MRLGEDISKLISQEDGVQLEISIIGMMTSDVVVVLMCFMKDIVVSNVNSTMVVTIKKEF